MKQLLFIALLISLITSCVSNSKNDEFIGEKGHSCDENDKCNSPELFCNKSYICEEYSDPCEGITCSFNGDCSVDLSNDPICICDEGFEGINCEDESSLNLDQLSREYYVGKTTISSNNCRWDTTNLLGNGTNYTIDEILRLFSQKNIFNRQNPLDIPNALEMKVCYDSFCNPELGTFKFDYDHLSSGEQIVLTLIFSQSTDLRDVEITPEENPFDCQLSGKIEYKFIYSNSENGKLDIDYQLLHYGTECHYLKFPEDCSATAYSYIDRSHQNIQEYEKYCSIDEDCIDSLTCDSNDQCTDEEGYKKKNAIKTTPLSLR